MFYHGILGLVLRRMSVLPLSSEALMNDLIEASLAIKTTFTKELCEILRQCDLEISHGKEDDLMNTSFADNFIKQGFTVSFSFIHSFIHSCNSLVISRL